MTDNDFAARRQDIDELLQKIIAAVATHNHVGVRSDDIVMILPTIMKVICDDAAESHMSTLRQHASEHEDIALRWRMDAKEASERIINASLEAGRRQIAQSTGDAAQATQKAIREEMAAALAELRQENESTKKMHGPVVMAGGILAFLGGVAALAAVVLRLI